MKTLHTQKKVIAVIPYAVALLLFVALVFSYSAIEAPAYASENDVTEVTQQQWRTNAPLQIPITQDEFTYIQFCPQTSCRYALTVTGAAIVSVPTDAVIAKKIADGVYFAELKKGKEYLFGFKSAAMPYLAEICISEEAEAFEWSINGSLAADCEQLLRGQEYEIAFAINGAQWDTKIKAESKESYIFDADGGKLLIDEECAVGGKGITFFAKGGDVVFEKSLTIIPSFENKIDIEGVYNDNTNRGLFWRYQSGITALTYNVDYAGQTRTVTIDSLNGRSLDSLNPGQLYPLEIGADISDIGGKSQSAEVSITGVQLASADGSTTPQGIVQSGATILSGVTWVGAGTQSNPYQVSSVAHFNDISSKNAANVYFKQTANLNFNNTETTRNVTFKGVYDGNSKQITNIKIARCTSTTDGGLFDANSGTIKNLKYVSVEMNFATLLSNVGGMIGKNSGTLYTPYYSTNGIGLHATMTIDGIASVGAVCGSNTGSVIIRSRVYVDINTSCTVGGLVGDNASGATLSTDISLPPSQIPNIYVQGYIYYTYTNLLKDVGGVVGYNAGGVYFVKTTVRIEVRVNSTDPSIKPHVGGIIGRQKSGGSLTGYTYAGSFWSNLTSAQKTYVDFSVDYIGRIE